MSGFHICFLCHEYPPGAHGGIGSFTQVLGRALARRGHTVHVVGLYDVRAPVAEADEGVRVTRLPHSRLPRLGWLQNAARLSRHLRCLAAEQPLELLEGNENAFALVARNVPGCRVLRMHGGHAFFARGLGVKPRSFRGWLERRSFARAHRFCAVSRYVAETTRALLALGKVPIEVIPNPVDTGRFQPQPQVPVACGTIAFVGTLCEKKGIRQLLLAIPRILAAVPAARLLVFGRDSLDPASGTSYRQTLEAAMPPEVGPQVEFRGYLENARLPQELAAAQVLVFPSHLEAHPVAWLEGLAMGKPVVAARSGPGPEVIEHGVSGLLCDPHDPEAIAGAVVRVLRDDALAMHLGDAARRRAVQEFSIERVVPMNEDFYGRCLGRAG